MSAPQAEEIAVEICRFLDRWVPRRFYSPGDRMACWEDLRSIIDLARRAAPGAFVEPPHEGPVD